MERPAHTALFQSIWNHPAEENGQNVNLGSWGGILLRSAFAFATFGCSHNSCAGELPRSASSHFCIVMVIDKWWWWYQWGLGGWQLKRETSYCYGGNTVATKARPWLERMRLIRLLSKWSGNKVAWKPESNGVLSLRHRGTWDYRKPEIKVVLWGTRRGVSCHTEQERSNAGRRWSSNLPICILSSKEVTLQSTKSAKSVILHLSEEAISFRWYILIG